MCIYIYMSLPHWPGKKEAAKRERAKSDLKVTFK